MTPISHHVDFPNDSTLLWGLSFANGYFELGMLGRAEHELDVLAPSYQDGEEVMALRCRILMERKRWPQVIAQTRRALRLFPGVAEFYIHAAMAHDMLGQPAEARDVWRRAPEALRSSGFFHLHVARFEAQLGNVGSAQNHLASALQIDPTLRIVARHDPKLAALVAKLGLN